MIGAVAMLNSLSLDNDNDVYFVTIFPTPRQTVSHTPDKPFVIESHGYAALSLAHMVTWYQNKWLF